MIVKLETSLNSFVQEENVVKPLLEEMYPNEYISRYTTFSIRIDIEKLLSGPLELKSEMLGSVVIDNIDEFIQFDGIQNKNQIMLLAFKRRYLHGSLTLYRNAFGKWLNYLIQNNDLTSEEISDFNDNVSLRNIGLLLNKRTTYTKKFIEVFNVANVYEYNDRRGLIYSLDYALANNKCRFCGNNLRINTPVYTIDGKCHYVCESTDCDENIFNLLENEVTDEDGNSYNKLEELPFDFTTPLPDKQSLFSDLEEVLVQGKISFKMHFDEFNRLIELMMSPYNKGQIKIIDISYREKGVEVITQPMGFKTYKKLISAIKDFSTVTTCSSSIVRLFNLSNETIEKVYQEAVQGNVKILTVPSGAVKFDLTTMSVTVENGHISKDEIFVVNGNEIKIIAGTQGPDLLSCLAQGGR